jgi:hypothetical protein
LTKLSVRGMPFSIDSAEGDFNFALTQSKEMQLMFVQHKHKHKSKVFQVYNSHWRMLRMLKNEYTLCWAYAEWLSLYAAAEMLYFFNFEPTHAEVHLPDAESTQSDKKNFKCHGYCNPLLRIPDPGSGAFLTPGSGIRNRFFRIPGKKFYNFFKIGPNFFLCI